MYVFYTKKTGHKLDFYVVLYNHCTTINRFRVHAIGAVTLPPAALHYHGNQFSTKLAKNYILVIPALSRDLIIYCKRVGIPDQGRDDEDIG